MSQRRQKFKFVPEEKRNDCIKTIISFFQDERDEEIGVVAAGQVLDFFLQTIGEEIYKKGIRDAKKLLKERLEDLDVELDLLAEK